MSHLKLPRTFLFLVLGTVAFQGAADELKDAGKIAPAAAQSLRWDVAQTAGTTPQTLNPRPTLGDNALELELASKYGITGTELQILASELRSRLLTKDTINRYQTGADAAQYAALSDAIYRDEGLIDFDKDGKADWKLDPRLNRKDAFTGFHGAVYVHTSRKEVVIAFEGTTPPDPAYLTTLNRFFIDLLNDVAGVALSDPQTVHAEALVKEALAKYGKDHRIVVTGHSLGGRLAQIVAASMALEAFTFNPAAVSKVTQKVVGPINPSRITNILMVSDVVNPVSKLSPAEQSRLGSDLGRRVEFYFPWSGFLREHSITTVAQRLSGVRRVYEDKIKPVLASQQKPSPAAANPQSVAKSPGSTVGGMKWKVSEGCYIAADPEYQSKLDALGKTALGNSDVKKGCVTFPYLGTPYDVDGRLRILIDAHAGIDLRAKTGDPVYAIDDGKIVYADLCQTGTPQSSQPNCVSKDGLEHSTLVIENYAKTHRVFYLHLSRFNLAVAIGRRVSKGDVLGNAGAIGTTSAHLHLEVWRSEVPLYCSRVRALSGSACTGKPTRVLFDKSKTTQYCERDDVERHTVNPAEALETFTRIGRWVETRLSTDSDLTLRGFGPVRVGMTVAEVKEAIGGPLFDEPLRTGCDYARPRYGPGGVEFMIIDGRVARIDINSCQLATRSGARIGDAESRIRSLYPGIEVTSHQYTEEGHYLTLVPSASADKSYRVVFETDVSRVTTFRAGKLPEVGYVEHCF